MKYRTNNIKTQHHILDGMFPILEEIKRINGVNGIIPGRIYSSPTQNKHKVVSIQRETKTGLKLFIHGKQELQEIFVLCNKGKIPSITNEINKRFVVAIKNEPKHKKQKYIINTTLDKQEQNNYYFLNLGSKYLSKLEEFCKTVEEKYNKDILTGISFVHKKDGWLILALVFTDKEKRDEADKLAINLKLKDFGLNEEDWTKLASNSKVCIIGNFTYKILEQLYP